MARGNAERRSKKKDKFREKKKHPYKKGGWQRTMNISKNSEEDKKKSKKKSKTQKNH